MKTSDFDYQLPPELIAQFPSETRSASRMLFMDKLTGELNHLKFNHLPELLNSGDLLVFNNTKVIPARIFGVKETGGQIEALIERILDDQKVLAHLGSSKPAKIGMNLFFGEFSAKVIDRKDNFFILQFQNKIPVLEILNQIGHIPLPPYIERLDNPEDFERYQTIFARYPGAVAAPTAGLHFDDNLFADLTAKKIETDFITLHVGAGTFQPVRADDIHDHVMHSEYMEISKDTVDHIQEVKSRGNKIIAVGTTSVRCLETAAQDGNLKPFQGETSIFIYPGYEFKCVDGIITNFHLPQSTLLMLVCAFGGYEKVRSAYQTAVEEKYRFYSYGDGMVIL